MDEKLKAEIDAMSYGEMLKKWRFTPIGDPMFRLGAAQYFVSEMDRKEKLLTPEQKVAASKSAGWE